MPLPQSFGSVKFISLNRNALLARLRDIAAHIRRDHRAVEEIRLFGSLARGDNTGMSDVDVLIVLEESRERDPLRRILVFLPYFDLDRGVDLLVYTRAELQAHLDARDAFARNVWEPSIAL